MELSRSITDLNLKQDKALEDHQTFHSQVADLSISQTLLLENETRMHDEVATISFGQKALLESDQRRNVRRWLSPPDPHTSL